MNIARCRRDGVPLPLHSRCWSCRALAGPGHVVARLAAFGLCPACVGRLDRLRDVPASPPPDRPALLDTRAMAGRLGVSPATVRKMAREGRLRVATTPPASGDPRGRRYRYVLEGDSATLTNTQANSR